MVTILGLMAISSFIAFCLGVMAGIKAEREWDKP